ncbi:MAG: ABC transporter ATP-binding protein, partial [Dolichospermum sp.]
MSIYPSQVKSDTAYRPRENDWRLFSRLVPYGLRYGKLLAISMLLLIPIAVASAIKPILVGEAVSLIRKEPTTYQFLQNIPLWQGLNILIGMLLIATAIRLVLIGVQGYLVQKLGQKITAAIREDLFDHV